VLVYAQVRLVSIYLGYGWTRVAEVNP